MATKHEEPHSPLSQTRRSILKKMLAGTGLAAGAVALPDKWTKPMVDKVLVPAHAQTSTTTTTTTTPCVTDTIIASSHRELNDDRYVIIIDSSNQVLASCRGDDGSSAIATVTGLEPGSYRVMVDCECDSQTITVDTVCSSETFTLTPPGNHCKTLVATVSIPDGTITPGNGQEETDYEGGCGNGTTNCG